MPVYNDLDDAVKPVLNRLAAELIHETPQRIAERECGGGRSADGSRFSYPTPAAPSCEADTGFGR